ncbi:hypothetical protein B0H10DRAFT_535042 [Mycena sp. CBHHK59/15]|nr:hypothetical protein B0H10DRAFT_535042 [Mycena sp. CBHHK59/15]
MATDGAPNVWNALCRANIENWKRDNPGKSKDAVTQLEAMWSESPRNPNSDVSATPAQIAKKKISKVADSSRPSGSETVSVTNTVCVFSLSYASSLPFRHTGPSFRTTSRHSFSSLRIQTSTSARTTSPKPSHYPGA